MDAEACGDGYLVAYSTAMIAKIDHKNLRNLDKARVNYALVANFNRNGKVIALGNNSSVADWL